MRQAIIRRKTNFSVSEKLLFLLVGGGIGATVALLLTPKSGEELREDIAGTTRKGIQRGRETATQIGTRAGEYYEVARDKAGEYYEVTRERASELYDSAADKARQLAENARDAAASQGNTLTAAIEAGRQAYYEEKRRSEATTINDGRINYPRELGENKKNEKFE
jgi:gas vesicle protein